MMLVAGGAVAGASALLAAPARDQIRNVARSVIVNSGVGSGFLSLADGTYDEWQGQVGSIFALGGGSRIRLAGVRPLLTSGARPQGLRTQSFAAFFEPLRGHTVAPDLIYTATHVAYGPLPLFLASASERRAPGRMVAVFN